jgi:hypothetical protein
MTVITVLPDVMEEKAEAVPEISLRTARSERQI